MSALLPPFGGSVSAANGGVWTQCVGQVAHFNLTPPLYVDGFDLLPFVLSGSSVEPDSTVQIKPSTSDRVGLTRSVSALYPLFRGGQ